MAARNRPLATLLARGPVRSWLLAGLGAATAIATLIPVVRYGYDGHWVRYIADDYCTSSLMHATGFWPTQLYWYDFWTGRFSFTAAVSVAEQFGMTAPKLLPALLMGALMAAIGGFGYWSRAKGSRTWTNLTWVAALAASGCLALLVLTPDLIQSLYWQTGGLTYFAPLVVFVATAAAIAYAARTTQPRVLAVLVGLLAFLDAGFSESFALMEVSLFVYLAFLFLLVYRRVARVYQLPILAALFGSVAGLLTVVLAPGNRYRFAYFPPHQSLSTVIHASVTASWNLAHTLTVQPAPELLGIVAGAALVMAVTSGHRATNRPKLLLQIVLAPILGLALAVASYLPLYYGYTTNTLLPDRTLILPIFTFILIVAYLGFVVGLGIRQFQGRYTNLAIGVVALVVGVAAIGMSAPRTTAAKAIDDPLRLYAINWATVDTKLRHGHGNAIIPPLEGVGGTAELQPDPTNWYNVCIANYYGVTSVKVQ